jgi:hypothetical protein
MEFWKAILGLARRKYVGLPILGLAVIIAAAAYLFSPAHYVSSTTMVLTIPTSGGTFSQDPSKPTGLTNPLLNFGDGLKTTSAILIQSMNTPEVAQEIGAAGGSTKITINDGSGNAALMGVTGPFVFIQGESSSAEEAQAVVLRAQQRIRDELLNRQKALNAPPITYITMVDVVPPSTPEVQRGAQLQLGAAGLVLTVITGLLGAYGAERLLAARRRKADGEAVEDEPEPDSPDPATVKFSPVPAPGQNGVPVNGSPVHEQVRVV